MKMIKLACALSLTTLLAACGTPTETPTGSSSSSSTGQTGSSSSSSSSSSSTGATVQGLGYSKLSDGNGGWKFEAADITAIMSPADREKSIKAFEGTLYKHLKDSGCGGCHSSASAGQAPLHTDSDVALAHDYALTRTNFADPENSKLVVRQKIDRHACAKDGTKNACSVLAAKTLAAVEEWRDAVEDMIPVIPWSVPHSEQISDADVEGWIANDQAQLSSNDKEFIKYTSLHRLHNLADTTAQDLEILRVGLSKALNSTARWAPKLVQPVDVNGKGLLYKFDTRDYWGYNKGVKTILFGGSDDDMAFGANKYTYKGVKLSNEQSKSYGYTKNITKDDNLAKLIWERILHGNVEGAGLNTNIASNIKGFIGKTSTNSAGVYIAPADFKWAETSQLIYTLTRPDVYNAIMLIPMYADQLEEELGIDVSKGMKSYEYVGSFEAITVDSRLLWRATYTRPDGKEGWYWKSWDIFSGNTGRADQNIKKDYAAGGNEIRFPWWANPIPKFVDPANTQGSQKRWSFISSLAQTGNAGNGFAPRNHANCDDTPGAVSGFGFCRHYSGVGGAMQSASEIIWDLPNGLQGYMLTGGFNQRRLDAFTLIVRDPRILLNANDDIAETTGYAYTKTGAGGSGVTDPRLNNGSSCIGCHVDGMNRLVNDTGDWVREYEATGVNKFPKGPYGADAWIKDANIRAQVKELYPPSDVIQGHLEKSRAQFMTAMAEIKDKMMIGENKNMFVEPVITAVEHVQRNKGLNYNYAQTTSN